MLCARRLFTSQFRHRIMTQDLDLPPCHADALHGKHGFECSGVALKKSSSIGQHTSV
jgi:hypothetical protein